MLFLVGEKSHGLLSIVPKTKDGTPITDFEAQTIKERSSNTEVKEWFAVAEYLRSFDKEGGVSQVPEYYSETLSRKVVDNNHNPIALISNPNGIALAVYSIILAAAAIIILTTILITKRRKKVKDKTKAQM
jgi:5'-nucleotidase/UDP-sugar diphosphatase